MAEEANLLRSMAYADKQAKITAVTVTDVPSLFTSQLTSGYKRKRLFIHNNSFNASGEVSGECYYGFSASMSPNLSSVPIFKETSVEVRINDDLSIYFCADSGEIGDLRVEELA